jgi:dTMP kinase
METREGIFIVIEGTDGSGKGTQFELLKNRLEQSGYPVAAFDFPQYDKPSSYFVKRYLNGDYGGVEEVGPYTSSLFYALDRFEAAMDIRRALSEGKVVICNRFTGSSMAHQGAKFNNTEERRGFFIWLDNLEFEMLRIPRPDISFVLRVPADIAQKLVDQKGERAYTDKKRDIHEANLSHLERAVSVYDDITQLFPKDFQRIDCVRGGKLLDIEAVHTLVWEKVLPLLPKPTGDNQTNPVPAPPVMLPPTAEPQAERSFTLTNASSLLTERLQRFSGQVRITPNAPTNYYTPVSLHPEVKAEFQRHMGMLLTLHAQIIEGLTQHGLAGSEAFGVAHAVLPLCTTNTVQLAGTDLAFKRLVGQLITDDLSEVEAAGATLLAQALQANPAFLGDGAQPTPTKTSTALKALAKELTDYHAPTQSPVTLTSVSPRNELDLVADMVYEHSNLPYRSIQDQVATWPMERKLAVVEAYSAAHQGGPALQKARYSWDIVARFQTLKALGAHTAGLSNQPLTPRYGYDVPGVIEDAELGDLFDECFDQSLSLYSALQRAGHQTEAQYATLEGHKQRWQASLSGQEFLGLYEQLQAAEGSQLIRHMHAALAEAHPMLAEIISQSAPANNGNHPAAAGSQKA